MKIPSLFLAFALSLNVAVAQTPEAPATTNAVTTPAIPPAPRIHPPGPVSSVTPKVPTTSPESRGAGWEKHALDNIAKSKTQADGIDVIFDGDSITYYWPARGKAIWTERYAKLHPFDFAISGDTTQSLLWRQANGQAQGLHPKLIVLMIGTNDMHYTSSPQDIADGVKTIIANYQKICPDAVILLQAIFPRGASATDPYRLKVKATNEILAKLGDGTKVIYMDFGDKFLTPDGTLTKEIMPDFLHPSAAGYQIWADAIQPTIDKYFPAK